MANEDGLIYGYLLDGTGGGRALDWAGVRSWRPGEGLLWVHLHRTGTETEQWLRDDAAIDPVVLQTLMADETRPRALHVQDALLVILRGVNLNPGANPDDMVAIRLWIDSERIITIRRRRLMAINDIAADLAAGHGPKRPGEFLVTLTDRLIERMGPVIEALDDQLDELENEIPAARTGELRSKLADSRQKAIALRRYVSPQRDAMSRLHAETVSWLQDVDRAYLREIADRTTRYVEDLESARERAAVTQDELAGRLAEQMNKTMYMLTLVASILLPPSLLTGLLGINVGGMPGVDSPIAFTLVVIAILALAAFEVWLLKRLRWL